MSVPFKDALNKGDPEAERRFKKLNDAYHYIMDVLGK